MAHISDELFDRLTKAEMQLDAMRAATAPEIEEKILEFAKLRGYVEDVVVTKRREKREGLDPCWRIYFDDRPTTFFIEKASEKPGWGLVQQYDLCHDKEGFISESSVYALMKLAEAMANPFKR